jgi:4,5-dihydroxyphthalate decarboxylase
MATESVEVLCDDYEHALAVGGTFGGVEIKRRIASTREMFQLALQHKPFEIAEFSISNYIMMRSQGARWLTALPIFPYRAFRHNIIHVRNDSPLKAVTDLRGKTIGLPDYSMTAAVWTRGLYKAEYGLDPGEIAWVSRLNQRFPTPPGVNLRLTGDDLEDLLERGEIDALLIPDLSEKAQAHRKFRRLLPNHPKDEREYYLKSGIYPPNHVLVVNLDVVKNYERIAAPVFEAFCASKAKALDRQLGATLVPWARDYWEETLAIFHHDPLPYGLTATNRRAVETVAGFLAEQGLIAGPVALADLFDPIAMQLSEANTAA